MKICSRQGEFELLRVYYRARSGGINRDIFSIFFNANVYCVYSLESPQRGDSNKYTQYTISQYKKEIRPKLSQICNYVICSKGPKKEFEPAVVNEPSAFEPLKFYCKCEPKTTCLEYHLFLISQKLFYSPPCKYYPTCS